MPRKSKKPATPTFALSRTRILCVIAVVVFLSAALPVIDHYWPYRYRNVMPTLQTVFASKIKIDHYHRIYLPHPGFIADGIVLRRNSALNLPPVGSVDHIRVEGRWIDLLLFRNRIWLVRAQGLHVIVPPVGSEANHQDFPAGSANDFTGPTTAVETLDLDNTTLDILRVGGGKYSFPIRSLVIRNLQKNKAIEFDVDMLNAKPTGHIQAHGTFGPLLADKLGDTPVTGQFTFTDVKLSDIGGISGGLTSKGSFHGSLTEIEVTADSNIPDFAVGNAQPTSISATSSGAVNALNGDVLLHAVDVHIARSTLHVQGSIAGAPKQTVLDLSVNNGRVQDILHPFLNNPSPIAGPVQLHAHTVLARGSKGATFLQRLKMDGSFEVPTERLTNPTTAQKLTAFSERAQGLPSPPPDSPDTDVLSSLSGSVHIQDGIAHAARLDFELPGASVQVSGTYDLRSQTANLQGDVRMQADISHVTTGFKSALLKPLAPMFKKKHAGAVVPIAITGKSGNFKIGQNILR